MCKNVLGVTHYGATVFYKDQERKNVIIDFVNSSQETLVKERFKGDHKLLSRFKKRISGKGITLEPRVMKHIEKAIERFYELINKGKENNYKFDGEKYLMPETEYIFDSKKIFTLVDQSGVITMSAGLDPEEQSTVNVELIIKSNYRLKKLTSFIHLDRSKDINKEYFTQLLKTHFRNLEEDAGLEHTGRFARLIKDSEKNFKEFLERKIKLFCELFKYSNEFVKRAQIRRAYKKLPIDNYYDDLMFTVKVFLGDERTEELLVTFKREKGTVLIGEVFNDFIIRRCFVRSVYKNDIPSNRVFLKAYSYVLGDTEPDSDDTFYINESELNFSSYKEDRSEGLVGYNLNRLMRKNMLKVEDHSTIVNSILKNTYGHVYLNKDADVEALINVFMNRSVSRFADRFSETYTDQSDGFHLLYEGYGDLLETDLLTVLELPIQRVDPGFLNQTLTSKKEIKEAFKHFPKEAEPYIKNATIVRTTLLTEDLEHNFRSVFGKENYDRLYEYRLLVEILDNVGKKREIRITFENYIYPLVKEVTLLNYETGETLELDIKNCQRTLLTDSNLLSKYLKNLLIYRHKLIRLFVLEKFTYKIVLYRRDKLLHMDRAIITNPDEIDTEIKNVLNLNTKEDSNDEL